MQLFEGFQAEGVAMPFTMEDFRRLFVKEHFPELSPKEKEEILRTLPPEDRLAGLTAKQIQEYLDRLSAEKGAPAQAAAEEVGRQSRRGSAWGRRLRPTSGRACCGGCGGATSRGTSSLARML
jgi:hypothetical protein